MPIETAISYLATIEYRNRLKAALDTARRNLTPREFGCFSPQVERKLSEADQEILQYEMATLRGTASLELGTVQRIFLAGYSFIESRYATRAHGGEEASVLLGSPNGLVTLLGCTPAPGPAQYSFPCY